MLIIPIVMRACEGCRRRKIKCDAATTNAWPCGACVRLKQNCVPPTFSYDRNQVANSNMSGFEKVLDFDNSSGDEEYAQHQSATQMFELDSSIGHPQSRSGPYSDGLGVFQTPPYSERDLSHQDLPYDDITGAPLHVEGPFRDQASFDSPLGPTLTASESSSVWNEQYSAAGLSSMLGELKIDESGVGTSYQQTKS